MIASAGEVEKTYKNRKVLSVFAGFIALDVGLRGETQTIKVKREMRNYR